MSLYFWFIFLIGLLGEPFVRSDSDVQCTYTNCTFDNGLCCWTQNPTSGLEWKSHSDGTPTLYTGHSKDHTSGNGDYIYTLLDNDGSKQASLTSPYLVGGTYCLSVWYQIYGSNVILDVLKTDSDTIFRNLYSNGNMSQHSLIQVCSEGNFQIDIRAGHDWTNDHDKGVIVIDDVSVSKTLCPLDCSFDSGFCAWQNVLHSRQEPGPWTKDNNNTDGDYIYTSIDNDGNKRASLISPYLIGGIYCLSVWYNISGINVALGVFKTDSDNIFRNLYSNENMWQHSLIQIASEGNFQIDIRAGLMLTDSQGRGVIAIDDVSASETRCPLDCSFDSGFCAWQNNNDGQAPWTWTKTNNSTDHYLLIANNDHIAERRAGLRSSWQYQGLKCLSLRFHVAGIKDNSLKLFLKRNNEEELIITISNKTVKEANVEINSSVPYQVVLIGEVQTGKGEDIYIKDIASVAGHCPIDCNSNPCLNGAACEQSNTDGNYTCVCSAGWTGQLCGDFVSTTEAPSTADDSTKSKNQQGGILEGTESSNSNDSTQSQNEQGGILEDSNSTSYILITSAGAVLLFIVGTVVVLLIIRRNSQRKRRIGNTKDRQRQQDNTNEINDTYAYELSESMYEQAGADNTDDVFKPSSYNEDNENEYAEAQYMHSGNVPDIKAEENVYNHLTQAKVESIVDQTYSHIPDVRFYPKSAGEKQQYYLNVKTQEKLPRNDKNNLEEDTIYNVLETSINSKPRSETMQPAHNHDEYDHIGIKQW